MNALGQRMGLDGLAVVLADFDIHADHVAGAQQLQHGCRQHQRTAVGDARLDDEVRLHGPDQFLHGHGVHRQLDERPASPREVVHVLAFQRHLAPGDGQLAELLVFGEAGNAGFLLLAVFRMRVGRGFKVGHSDSFVQAVLR